MQGPRQLRAQCRQRPGASARSPQGGLTLKPVQAPEYFFSLCPLPFSLFLSTPSLSSCCQEFWPNKVSCSFWVRERGPLQPCLSLSHHPATKTKRERPGSPSDVSSMMRFMEQKGNNRNHRSTSQVRVTCTF